MSEDSDDVEAGTSRVQSSMQTRRSNASIAVNSVQQSEVDYDSDDDDWVESATAPASASQTLFTRLRSERSGGSTTAGAMQFWSLFDNQAGVSLFTPGTATSNWRTTQASSGTTGSQHYQSATLSAAPTVQRHVSTSSRPEQCFNSRISAFLGRFMSDSNSSNASAAASTSGVYTASPSSIPRASSSSTFGASSSYVQLLQTDDEDMTQSPLSSRVHAASSSSQLSTDSSRAVPSARRTLRRALRQPFVPSQRRIAVRMSQASSQNSVSDNVARRDNSAGSSSQFSTHNEHVLEQQRDAVVDGSRRGVRNSADSGAPKVGTDATDDFQVRLRAAEQRFLYACEQVSLLNRQLERLQLRYEHACDRNQRAFRYTLRLRIAVVEGVRNMYYEYATQQTHEMTAIRCLVNSRRSSLQSIAL